MYHYTPVRMILRGTWAPLKLIRLVLFLHVAVHTANHGIDHTLNAAEQEYATERSRLRAERLRRICPPFLHVFCMISTFFARMAQRVRHTCATVFLVHAFLWCFPGLGARLRHMRTYRRHRVRR